MDEAARRRRRRRLIYGDDAEDEGGDAAGGGGGGGVAARSDREFRRHVALKLDAYLERVVKERVVAVDSAGEARADADADTTAAEDGFQLFSWTTGPVRIGTPDAVAGEVAARPVGSKRQRPIGQILQDRRRRSVPCLDTTQVKPGTHNRARGIWASRGAAQAEDDSDSDEDANDAAERKRAMLAGVAVDASDVYSAAAAPR